MLERLPQYHQEENNDALRVSIISESSIGPTHANGVSNSVKRVARYLREQGHEAQILTPSPAPDNFEYEGFPVIPLPAIPIREFRLAIPYPQQIRQVINKFQPDIVHFASPISGASRAGLKLDVAKVAIYQTDVAQYAQQFTHDAIDRFIAEGVDANWLKKSGGELSEQFMARRIAKLHNLADVTLAPSSAAVKRLVGFGVDPTRITTWTRGVDTKQFSPDRKATTAVHQQHDLWSHEGRRTVVGYVGRLAPEKEVEKLAGFLDPQVQLVIVGDGPLRATLEKTLPRGTIFTGELRGDELANAYASFDIFAHTGAAETFGQTLQEAMATGLPVVAPASGGPLDIVTPGYNGYLFKPSDIESLHHYMYELISRPNARRIMGAQALASVQNKTWENINAQLIAHYRSTIASRVLTKTAA